MRRRDKFGGRPRRHGSPTPAAPRFSPKHIDPHTPPGKDFYQYATGRWLATHSIPPDQVEWGAFRELIQLNNERLRQILEHASRDRSLRRNPLQREVGDFYAAATDTRRRNALGPTPMKGLFGSIDRISTWEDLATVLGELHDLGMGGLFDTETYPDRRKSRVYAFYIKQAVLSMPDREYYLSARFRRERAAYRPHVVRLLTLAGTPHRNAQRIASRVLAIETRLARASRSRAELRDRLKNYHKVRRKRLSSLTPTFPWERYLRRRGALRAKYVIVGQPEFLQALGRLLRQVGLPVWKDYLRWLVVRATAPLLSARLVRESFRFNQRILLGQRKQEPDWRTAVRLADRVMGESVGRLFVQQYFPASSARRLRVLVADIREVFQNRLRRLPWMSPRTRREALLKFARLRLKIGHPRRYRDDSRLRIHRDDHVGNVWRALQHEARRQAARIGRHVGTDFWQMTPATVNAYSDSTQNEIVFLAGILQPPFFDPTMDDAVNYGAIGMVIGHEITHGYDDQGRRADWRGNLRDWWTPRDAREFRRRARRIIGQYDRFQPLPGLHINGGLTVGENIADFGGVSIAYEALERRLRRTSRAPASLDGLTPEQRFFVSYAQMWREKIRPGEARRLLTIDGHSPTRFRVIGPLRNFAPFYEAFDLRPSDSMWVTPSGRVQIW